MLLQIEQNTPEWEEMRRSKIGASDTPTIMGVNPYKTPQALWEEKVLGKKSFVSDAMRHGKEMEPIALSALNDLHNVAYRPTVFQSDTHDFMIASLDGFSDRMDGVSRAVEIKCPQPATFRQVSFGDIPIAWKWQMQHQMFVAELQEMTLFVFSSEGAYEYKVTRDENMITQCIEKCKEFYESMINFEAPKPARAERTDAETRSDIDGWIRAKIALDHAKKAMELAEQKLIDRGNGESYECCGVKVTKCSRKGNVDYSKVPELQGVNLDVYRKPDSEYWRIQ